MMVKMLFLTFSLALLADRITITCGFNLSRQTTGNTKRADIDSTTASVPTNCTQTRGNCVDKGNGERDITNVSQSCDQDVLEPSDCIDEEETEESLFKVVSPELANLINNALSYVNMVFCGIGLIANTLNVAVFLSQAQSSTNCYLISIAAVGVFGSGTSLAGFVHSLIRGPEAFTNYHYFAYNIMSLQLYIGPVGQRSLNLLILLVSIERFLAVTFPLKSKEFAFSRFPKTIIGTSIVTVAVFHIFSPIRYVIKPVVQSSTNKTIHALGLSQIFNNSMDEIKGASLASKIIFVYILLGSALLANLMVVWSLKKHSVQTRKMKTDSDADRASRQERRITVTVITSSLVFLLLVLPLNTTSILLSARNDLFGIQGPYRQLFFVIMEATACLANASLSSDFITYMMLSAGFRGTCLRILRINSNLNTGRQLDQSTNQTEMSQMDRASHM